MTPRNTVEWDSDEVVLVTGGAGFIGSHLVRELVRQNKRVVVYDCTPDASYIADCIDEITFVYGDVADMPHLMSVMTEYDVDFVFHLAYLLVPDSDNRLGTAIQTNCTGFHNVLEAARIQQVRRVVWASSMAACGLAEWYPEGPMSEDVFIQPSTLYGACKLFNEFIARYYREDVGLDNIGFRKPIVYGLGKSRRRDLSLAHVLVENALLGRRVELPPVDYTANWVYVKDAVRAYLLAARVPSTEHLIFNIGGDVLNTSEVVDVLKKVVSDIEVHRQQDFGLPNPVEVWNQDRTRAREELGFEYTYSLEEGARDYLQVIEEFGDQYKSAWSEFRVKSLV